MANPPHAPTEQTRRTVESMSGYGIPQEEIARIVGIDPKTLRLHYREELDTGSTKANAKVAESLYKKAIGDGQGAVTAAIFWAKTRMGWKEPQTIEVTGKDGGPIETNEVSPRERIAGRLAGITAAAGSAGDTGEPE